MNLRGVLSSKKKAKARALMNPELMPDLELEKSVQPESPELNPMVAGLQKRSGLLSYIRNKRNKKLKMAQDLDAL